MKRAIGYSRISEKGQSFYSLPGQRDTISEYCHKNDIQLLAHFEEDGQSAKNFDRLSWAHLEAFIKEHHKEIDYLIVIKYDRFSRHLADALVMIDKLEKKYKITILSVFENIGVHPKSPAFFQFRTQLLLNANIELNYIKDRTAYGMHNGAKQGRFLHSAPFGYLNARDDNKRPIIVIDTEKAHLVNEAFRLFAEGMNMQEIRKKLKPYGLNVDGNSALRRLLSNPAYAGLIKVPEYYDTAETLIEGKHQAIVERSLYWTVQGILDGRRHNNRHNNEEVPLRGSLHCKCGKLMTAGNSKGRNAYYWYYTCSSCSVSFPAKKLHSQFDELLKELSLPDDYLAYLQTKTVETIQSELRTRNDALDFKNREIKAVKANIESIEEKYITNKLDYDTYIKFKGRYENEYHLLNRQADDLKAPLADAWAKYSESIYKLADIQYLYTNSPMELKKSFVNLVFDNTLGYWDACYRTAILSPVFSLKAAPLKERGLLQIEQPTLFSGVTPVCAPDGNSIEHFFKILSWMSTIKAA